VTTPSYRPDIDGLRAIAVLAVVFYHTGFKVISGGYVGVDVFFVISGYLITTIIVREIIAGQFSIAGFYERRMRRILPAVVTTVAVCLIVGYFLFESKDFDNLARSSIANNLFLANIFFYWQTGYFDASAELKPLLHTWSLSIEEQYYVVTPLLLMAVGRFFKQKFLLFVVPIFAISFAACVIGMASNPSAVFYLLPTRAWELLIGSILAIAVLPRLSSEIAMQSLSVLGALMLFFSIFAFNDETVFPGAAAAIPTFGTAILIYTGRAGTTPINRVLSIKPVIFVGLISYSLYLWHWPIIVFTRYLKASDLELVENVLLLIPIFVISILSWRYIETPFRKKKLLPTRKTIFVGSFVATTLLVVAGLSAVVSIRDTEWRRWRSCENLEERVSDGRGYCTIGDDASAPTFLVWGDSHARALMSAANESAKRSGKAAFIASTSACSPLQGMRRVGKSKCLKFTSTVLSFAKSHPDIETVILIGRWAISAEGTRYPNEDGDPFEIVDTFEGESRQADPRKLFETGLSRTVRSLLEANKKVVIVGPVPEVGHDVPSVNHIALITNRDVNSMIAPTVDEFETRNEKVFSVLSRLENELGVRVVLPSDILCDEAICSVALEDGTSLYRDDHHLSTFGSKYVSEIFDPVFAGPK
jgi:peptidoglycan/LPS O-acetylase OafA/YrhL